MGGRQCAALRSSATKPLSEAHASAACLLLLASSFAINRMLHALWEKCVLQGGMRDLLLTGFNRTRQTTHHPNRQLKVVPYGFGRDGKCQPD